MPTHCGCGRVKAPQSLVRARSGEPVGVYLPAADLAGTRVWDAIAALVLPWAAPADEIQAERAAMRREFPGCNVQLFRRRVRAGGVALELAVIVARRRRLPGPPPDVIVG